MKILVATDGSQFSQAAIEKACELAEGREAVSFKVISVFEPQVPMAAEPYALSAQYYQKLDDLAEQRSKKVAQEAVAAIESRLSRQKVYATTVVQLGIPSKMIIEEAEDWDADLIVVGSHGYGFWGRLALGSVSDAVIHQAPCSVLIVKSPQKETTK